MILIALLAISIWCGVIAGGWLGTRVPEWVACILFTAISLPLNARVFGTLDSYIAPTVLLILGLLAQHLTRFAPGIPGAWTVFLFLMLAGTWIFEPKRAQKEARPRQSEN